MPHRECLDYGVRLENARGLGPAVEYWLDLAGKAGGLPRRSDLDLAELAQLAPDSRLIEAARAPAFGANRFRYRELGGLSVEVPGRDVTDEVAGLGWIECDVAELALATRSPVARCHPVAAGEYGFDVLALPFSQGSGPGDAPMLLIALSPSARE
jgi:hypothetical protein